MHEKDLIRAARSIQSAVPAIRVAAALGVAMLVLVPLAEAGVNFTSGKVYVQQKVYDKACWFLEQARKEEPENTQVYSLLAFARAQRRQFASAGAAFEKGIKISTEKKDKKRLEELQQNRLAVVANLYNQGVGALNKAGSVRQSDDRTADAGTPQAAVEKERGSPKDFSRFTEGNNKTHEFWYYPEAGLTYAFTPGSDEPMQSPYRPFAASVNLDQAIADTTIFGPFSGASFVAEAAYDFELSAMIDPNSVDTYKNLSYVYEVLGRTDDAIRAAQRGLQLKPGEVQLQRNLRVAAMGRGNRLFNSGKYQDAIPAYRTAMAYDSASTLIYMTRIADAWYKMADPMQKGPERNAAYDSAASMYTQIFTVTPPESTMARENAIYNAAVIQVTLEKLPEAVKTLDKAVQAFPQNKDLLSLAGQTKYQAGDNQGAVDVLRKALVLDPKDATIHQFLFLSLNKLNKKDESVSEYTIYKALSDGKPRTGPQLKTWVDSADNRLGPNHQLKTTLKSEGYPEEVRTFSDGDKILESWFYWSKGKAVTFMEGQVFSQATFPTAK